MQVESKNNPTDYTAMADKNTPKPQLEQSPSASNSTTKQVSSANRSVINKLKAYGGFAFLEQIIDDFSNMNPERKARRNIFLTDEGRGDARRQLTGRIKIWLDLLKSGESADKMRDFAKERAIEVEETLNANLLTALKRTRELEASYRSVAHFFKNTEESKVKNLTIVNAELSQLTDLDNTLFIDHIADELKQNFDRLDLRRNYSLLVVPGYLGSNAVLDKWAKIAHDNKALLVTDFQNLESPEDVVDMFFSADHTGGEVYKSINEVESVHFDLKKSEISELERMGLVPMVNEYSRVMAFSAKTLFNGDNIGLQTYSVVRVFDYITKVLFDFLNRRAFENWTTRTEADLRAQIVKFLDGVQGPSGLIEKFKVLKIEQDPNQKDRVLLDIHITPYFPAKSFVIQLAGHKGDKPEDTTWESEYRQE